MPAKKTDEDIIEGPSIPDIIINAEDVTPEIVWKKLLTTADGLFTSMAPNVVNGKVLHSFHDPLIEEKLICRDKLTGEFLWEWQDFINHPEGIYSPIVYSNQFIFTSNFGELHSIDVNTGQSLTKIDIEGSSPNFLSKWENWIVRNHQDPGTTTTVSHLCVTDINDLGQWDTIYTYIPPYEDALATAGLLKVERNAEGDTILLIGQSRQPLGDANAGELDLLYYNLSQEIEIWKFENFNEGFASSLFENGRIYYNSGRSIVCRDESTFELIWEKTIPDVADFILDVMYQGDTIFVNPQTRSLYAYDKNTGSLIWENTDTGSNCGAMIYDNGKIYFNSLGRGRLYVVDAATGNNIWAARLPKYVDYTPESGMFMGAGMTLDTETGYIYTSDYKHILCLKGPDAE